MAQHNGNREFNSRIVHKHDVEVNWNKAKNFIPLLGEIIIYDIDENHSVERFKIGDGKTTAMNLPFHLEHEVNKMLDQILFLANNTLDAEYENGELIITKGITIPENLKFTYKNKGEI